MSGPESGIYHWAGDPDRPGLALHPMMGAARIWAGVAAALDGALDLTAFDMPGHGRGPEWQPGEDLHGQVARMAGALISRPVDLIGHSYGATVALRLAQRAPHAVRTLTLIEPVLFAAAPKPDPFNERLGALVQAGDMLRLAQEFLEYWGGGVPRGADPVRLELQARMVIESGPVLSEDSEGLLAEGALETLDMPVLIVTGAASPKVTGEIADALAARMPDVGRATVPEAGHMLPLTHPRAVAELIALNLERG